jgi:hypothetical protein
MVNNKYTMKFTGPKIMYDASIGLCAHHPWNDYICILTQKQCVSEGQVVTAVSTIMFIFLTHKVIWILNNKKHEIFWAVTEEYFTNFGQHKPNLIFRMQLNVQIVVSLVWHNVVL